MPRPTPPRLRLLAALAAAVALLALLALAARTGRAPERPPAPPTPVEAAVARWRAGGRAVPSRPAGALVEAARAALAADLPARAVEARDGFAAALAADPSRLDALAGWCVALAETAGEEVDARSLEEAHGMLDWALERSPGRADLLAARARLLLLVRSPRNDAEARATAARAIAAAPGDADAVLAAGLADLLVAPAAAAAALEAGAAAHPGDLRLVTAAARARWAAGDAPAAHALAVRRLALDPGQPAALELAEAIEEGSARFDAARARLVAWSARDPAAALPRLLLGRLAAQIDGDLPAARRWLAAARPLAGDGELAARILAQQAAVAAAAGDDAGAAEAVAAALSLVPASAPARYQAALLAFRRGDRRALAESAGVVGLRGGAGPAARLAALGATLGSATLQEAADAWRRWAETAPGDPGAALAAGGAVAGIGLTGSGLDLVRRARWRDPVEARLRRRPTDDWDGPRPLADAARRFAAIGRTEPEGGYDALVAAAATELLLGHSVAAGRLAAEAVAGVPQRGEARLLAAQVALDQGRPGTAVGLAAAGAARLPGSAEAASMLGRALAAAGRGPEALRAWAPALSASPAPSAARIGAAALLARAGRVDDARALLDAALHDDPSVGAARGALLDLARGRPVSAGAAAAR